MSSWLLQYIGNAADEPKPGTAARASVARGRAKMAPPVAKPNALFDFANFAHRTVEDLGSAIAANPARAAVEATGVGGALGGLEQSIREKSALPAIIGAVSAIPAARAARPLSLAARARSLLKQLKDNGGFTVDAAGRPQLTGFSVGAGKTPGANLLQKPIAELTEADMVDFLKRHPKGQILGGWVDNGVAYIEPATLVKDKDAAMKLGRERGELAVGDLAAYARGDFDAGSIRLDTPGSKVVMGDRDAALEVERELIPKMPTPWDAKINSAFPFAETDFAAVKTKQGDIFRGADHARAVGAANAAGQDVLMMPGTEQGFILRDGSFVSRADGQRKLLEAAAHIKNERARAQVLRSPGHAHDVAYLQKQLHANAPAIVTAPSQRDVFDVSKLGLDIPSGVSVARPDVRYPPRADTSVLGPVIEAVRKVYTPNAKRALKETPEAAAWYDLTQVRDAMDPADFRQFMLFMGPTSSGTKVPENLRQASKMFELWKTGQLSLADLKNGTLKLPTGYSNRRQKSVNSGIARILETGNLDPLKTPKTYRYANQLAGDMWGGTALDMHVGRQIGLPGLMMDASGDRVASKFPGFPEGPSYPETKFISSSPSDTHYPIIEDEMIKEANKLGVAPAQYQALGWVGGGAKTEVSDTKPLLSIFNERLRETAKKYGYPTPQAAFDAFQKGNIPLWALTGLTAGGLLTSDDF